MPNWPSQSFMTDKNITVSCNANHITAYHDYFIVFVFLHSMLQAAASAKSWYVSAGLDGVKSQNYNGVYTSGVDKVSDISLMLYSRYCKSSSKLVL